MSDVLGPVVTPPDRFALEQWLLKMPTALKEKLGIGPAASGNVTEFLRGDGTYASPPVTGDATKVTAKVPYDNDGYITLVINGTPVNVMTTA